MGAATLAASPEVAPIDVAALREEHAERWRTTRAELPDLGPRVGWRRHFGNERAAGRLVDSLADELDRLPADEEGRRAWRDSVSGRLRAFGAERLGWPGGYGRLLFADAFLDSSVGFARAARAFDPTLPIEGLGQALRNVWIGNSLQMRLGREVRCGEGLFAYSMLYPLTDNRLDDPRLDASAKRAFNRRFGRRLAGEPVTPADAAEAAVFALVSRIEGEYPRREYPEVHESLLAIHAGQTLSLAQQDDPELDDGDLLDISCEKGGTSVLADLWLVAGEADEAEQRFAFGYGVFLQLLDDLQDVGNDLAAGHQTLFTRAAARGPLDAPAARLARFVDEVLDGEPLADEAAAERRDLVRRNCRTLLVASIAAQPRRFTWRFRRAIERRWPFTLGAMRRLRARAEKRFAKPLAELRDPDRAGARLDEALAGL
ncbi:MAG: hypothetical protein U0599_21360 [Vicinamibacteria bacterium]